MESPRRLTNLSSTCFVSPKATGIVSLILQFALLIVSVLVALFFFYHVGGYEYMSWNENSTILEPISHLQPLDSSAPTLSRKLSECNDILGFTGKVSVKPGRFEETEKMRCYLQGIRLDMLELIRISTLVYVAISVLWLISIAFLLLSIKFEVLDMVIVNAVLLTIASTYAFVHALLQIQSDLSWRTMAIVIGCAVTLICTTILCAVALALVIAWYKYIVYMNNNEKVRILILTKREPQQAGQEYAMPNVTRPSELPYLRESPVNNFTPF
ncbi:unnamed protein product [Heligmosomoides polygyrus]|uniref:Uncharacterized protein n=1 Tax=Heligmosomoides polygyrus TaxID=6339 RepID=A0A3P8AMS0_HELPZ|nr:unnamed protein product [Heligmosomoides polygyrus]